MIWKKTLFGLLLGFVSCTATPSGVDVPPGAKLALINGTLIDGTGAAAVENALLAIGTDGKIVAVGRQGEAPIPSDCRYRRQGGDRAAGFYQRPRP